MKIPFIILIAQGLRIGAAFEWAILIYWILRARPEGIRARILVAYSLGVIAYLVDWLPLIYQAPAWVLGILLFVAFLGVPLMWISSMALFQDQFSLRPWMLGPVILAELIGFGTLRDFPTSTWFYSQLEIAPRLSYWVWVFCPQFQTLIFAALAITQVTREGAMDLVEPRIRFRKAFVIGTGLMACLVVLSEITGKAVPGFFGPFDALVAVVAFFYGHWISYLAQDKGASFFGWVETKPAAAPDPALPTDHLAPEAESRLEELMSVMKAYLKPDLSISSLAQQVGVPEYRLRRHINRKLGFRNFNQYVNRYRVEEAKKILSSVTGASVPIYNLAMDLGFGSLSAFNRVFKEMTGKAPSEYKLVPQPVGLK